MKKQRIIISSQNNPLFRGIHAEQQYDQRDGLAQVGAGDIVVTTDPIEQSYIDYWKSIDLSIPHLIVAGPFDERYILSELIANSKEIQKEILAQVPDKKKAQIEFFTVSDSERKLLEVLGINSSTNISFAETYQRKTKSKKLFDELGLSSLPFAVFDYYGYSDEELQSVAYRVNQDSPCIFKKDLGTGGVALGGMFMYDHSQESLDAITKGLYIVEPVVEILTEISCHWYIDDDQEIDYIGLFEQIAEDTSYIGVQSSLENVSSNLLDKIKAERNILVNAIAAMGGRGYMCCDIIVTTSGQFYWSDLNPRKGAAIYVVEAVKRLNAIHGIDDSAFYHKHVPRLPKGRSFKDIKNILGDLMFPKQEGYILITNPGVIKYGYLDITAVAGDIEKAKNLFHQALSLVKN